MMQLRLEGVQQKVTARHHIFATPLLLQASTRCRPRWTSENQDLTDDESSCELNSFKWNVSIVHISKKLTASESPSRQLVFTFETEDSLLLVSYADYLSCNTAKPIQFWDGMPGGLPRTVLFPLADHGFSTLYFIGGYKGKCAAGQKVHIDVLD